MSNLEYEEIATIRVLRDRVGQYVAKVDFGVHVEVTPPMCTVGGLLQRAADIVCDDLRTRKTDPGAP